MQALLQVIIFKVSVFGLTNIGALIIRIGFGGTLYYTYNAVSVVISAPMLSSRCMQLTEQHDTYWDLSLAP